MIAAIVVQLQPGACDPGGGDAWLVLPNGRSRPAGRH
jgi:hypothetical protein